MAARPIPPGSAADRLSEIVRLRRERLGLTLQGLSDRLAALGRPIPLASLSKVENRTRRVDVDDLVALADVLGFSLADLIGKSCLHCAGSPPTGFTCNTCGRGR